MHLSFFLKITYLTVFSLRDKPIIPDRTISTILQVSRIEERNDSSLLLVPIIKKALNEVPPNSWTTNNWGSFYVKI